MKKPFFRSFPFPFIMGIFPQSFCIAKSSIHKTYVGLRRRERYCLDQKLLPYLKCM
jgi:hypothetical protein